MSVTTLPTPQERIEEGIREIVGVLNRAHAELVDLTAQALESEAWAGHGIVSANHWLVLRAGLSRGRARQVLTVARRADELPVTMELLRQGRISLEQALPIASHVPAEYEESVADLAVYATVPQINRATATTAFPDASAEVLPEGHLAPSGTGVEDRGDEGPVEEVPAVTPVGWHGPGPASDPSRLSMYHDGGRFYLRFDAPSHVGVVVENAIREARDALWRAAGGHDDASGCIDARPVEDATSPLDGDGPRDDRLLADRGRPVHFSSDRRPAVTLADGLAELARTHLGGLPSLSRRDAYRIYVHLDTRGGWLTGRPLLPGHVVDQLTCDGVLRPVWETEGSPVNVGRAQRTVPPHTRRLIHERDRGCRYPGCPAADAPGRHVDIHHITHWRDGGPSDLCNLVSLCPSHHEAQHRGLFTMRGDPNLPAQDTGSLRFYSHAGWQIRTQPPPAPRPNHGRSLGEARNPGRRHQPFEGPTGEPLITRWVSFSPSTPRPDAAPRPDAVGGHEAR